MNNFRGWCKCGSIDGPKTERMADAQLPVKSEALNNILGIRFQRYPARNRMPRPNFPALTPGNSGLKLRAVASGRPAALNHDKNVLQLTWYAGATNSSLAGELKDMSHYYSQQIDNLIFKIGVAEWPAVEIAELVGAICDQRGFTVEQSTKTRTIILDMLNTIHKPRVNSGIADGYGHVIGHS